MNDASTTNTKYNVAIIGSGPAGFYAADHLFKNQELTFHIDVYERLPTSFVLV